MKSRLFYILLLISNIIAVVALFIIGHIAYVAFSKEGVIISYAPISSEHTYDMETPVTGVIKSIHFSPMEKVSEGDLLIEVMSSEEQEGEVVEVLAPMDGIITSYKARIGQEITPESGKPLLTIEDHKFLTSHIQVTEKEASLIKVGTHVGLYFHPRPTWRRADRRLASTRVESVNKHDNGGGATIIIKIDNRHEYRSGGSMDLTPGMMLEAVIMAKRFPYNNCVDSAKLAFECVTKPFRSLISYLSA